MSHVKAGVRKVKLAAAIIGICTIPLPKTFIDAANDTEVVLPKQTPSHFASLFSALAIALADRVMQPSRVGHV